MPTILEFNATTSAVIVVENFNAVNVSSVATFSDGSVALAGGNVYDAWVYGTAYGPDSTPSSLAASARNVTGQMFPSNRPAALLDDGSKYPALAPPQYEQYSVDQFVNIKTVEGLPVQGDGYTDDTANINAILSRYANCSLIFFPAGTYLVTDTVFVPAGSRIVGEALSTISCNGTNFSDESNPRPMFQVGNPGDVGVAQVSDMLFTLADILPGAILVQVNIAGSTPGDVAFWNFQFRVGGARGSLIETTCTGSAADCPAAFMHMQIGATSSLYLENSWLWSVSLSPFTLRKYTNKTDRRTTTSTAKTTNKSEPAAACSSKPPRAPGSLEPHLNITPSISTTSPTPPTST